MTLKELEPIQPDDKGMVTLIMDGSERRFLKSKLIDYLHRNGAVNTLKQPVIKKPKKEVKVYTGAKRKAGRPVDPNRVKVKGPSRGEAIQKECTAIFPDGTEQRFPSCRKAALNFKVTPTAIHRFVIGRYEHKDGIKFKIAG